VNPLARIVFVVIVSVPLLVSLDAVSAGVTLLLEIATWPLWRGSVRLTGRRAGLLIAVVATGVVTSGIATLLYGRAGGTELFTWGPVRVTELSVSLAIATMLRVAALVLPSVLVFATLDIAHLADALDQLAHLPARFVWGSVAGLRLIQLTATDFMQVRFARRARGLPSGPMRALMPLLVLSLRRAESLSMAMDARAFDTGTSSSPFTARTHYRASVLTWRDGVGVAVAVIIATCAVAASVIWGEWRFVIS
jgi:energy-coupling factor transport system permease protein